MKKSVDRILTTHAGSLARPLDLFELIDARRQGRPVDSRVFRETCKQAVDEIVRQQAQAGIDVISDGEQSKPNFSTYVRNRLSGFGKEEIPFPKVLDARELSDRWAVAIKMAPCIEPVEWKAFSEVEDDIANLKAASAQVKVEDIFMTSVSPGTLFNWFPNRYYASDNEYFEVLSNIMKREYEAIVNAGFVLQLDCPDMGLHDMWMPDLTVDEFRGVVARNVEALNYAVRDIAPENIRMHVCWGAGERPELHAVPLEAIADELIKAKIGALSIVGANGRHEHEYKVWQRRKLPDGMILIPGVIDNSTNIIEHPEWVAERIVRYANLVGRERVIAGTDCGFGTGAQRAPAVGPQVAMAKLASLAEGARIATQALWARN